MRPISELTKDKPWVSWLLFLGTLVIVFCVGLFAASIMERRTEALLSVVPPHELKEWEPRNKEWGKYFPREYETYMRTAETSFRSKYGGSMPSDMLKEHPALVVLWAGYAFSKDYNQGRGHFYAIEDIRNTLRTGAPMKADEGPMPGTCWGCKSPDVPRMMADLGPSAFYQGKWASLGAEIVNPIGCADCHDSKTMGLRISRPALIEAFARRGKDIGKASHQEMRSLVCAQCHVEYYFKGDGKYLTFPWDKGISVEAMEEYYDSYEFVDWQHSISKAPMLKAQHPDWEVFSLGIHSQRGVSCADCHMPYRSEGGVKFTNHHIRSPLEDVASTCQVCHRESESDLLSNVYERQDKNREIAAESEMLLVRAHLEAGKAWSLGATEEEMKPALKLIRHAQWRWDFAVASHGASFHAPLEVARILSSSVNKAQEARLLLSRILSRRGFNSEVPLPDISTKEKAQLYIGLDIEAEKQQKKRFIEEVVPKWDEAAKQRESAWGS